MGRGHNIILSPPSVVATPIPGLAAKLVALSEEPRADGS